MDIRGQAALVTGAGSGIGADVARHLAKAGAKVAVLDINKDAAEAVAKEIGGVGIGFFIWDAWNSSRLTDIIVALVYIGLVGFVLDKLVSAISTLVTRGTAAS